MLEIIRVSYKEKPVNVRIVFTWAETIICEDEFLVKIDSKDSSPESSIVGCAVLTGAGAVTHWGWGCDSLSLRL